MKIATLRPKTKNTSSARVVEGKLILSYPDALTPIVWQMDLVQARASAMEVRENNGTFMLVLKTAKGETTDIAPFETKEEAVQALMAAARALENAHGQIRPIATAANESIPAGKIKKRNASRWIAGVLGLIMIFILLSIWGSLTPRPAVNGAGSTPSSAFNRNAPAEQNGVPLSADEFLRSRPPQQ